MLPLSPGCKAIIIYGQCSGTEVTCIKYVGIPNEIDTQGITADCWKISIAIPWRTLLGSSVNVPYCPTKYLMRIDGHEEYTSKVTRIIEKTT